MFWNFHQVGCLRVAAFPWTVIEELGYKSTVSNLKERHRLEQNALELLDNITVHLRERSPEGIYLIAQIKQSIKDGRSGYRMKRLRRFSRFNEGHLALHKIDQLEQLLIEIYNNHTEGIKSLALDEQIFRERVSTIISDTWFWENHFPAFFQRGSSIYENPNDYTNLKLSSSDFKLVYSRLCHMAAHNVMTFFGNHYVICELSEDAVENINLNLNGDQIRHLLPEQWFVNETIKSISNNFHQNTLDVFQLWQEFARKIKTETSCPATKQEVFLNLDKDLRNLQSVNTTAECHKLLKKCEEHFESLTNKKAQRPHDRQKRIVQWVNIASGVAKVGMDIRQQMTTTGILLGNYLDVFATIARQEFYRHNSQQDYADRFKHAISFALQKIVNLTDIPSSISPSPKSVWFGIDFMIASSSKESINKGDYQLIVSDVNLSPRGLGLFEFLKILDFRAQDIIGNIASTISTYAQQKQVVLITDSLAMKHNQRARTEVLSFSHAISECVGYKIPIITIDPQCNTESCSIFAQFKQSEIQPFWLVRDAFFAKLNQLAIWGIQNEAINDYFFMHGIAHRHIIHTLINVISLDSVNFFL